VETCFIAADKPMTACGTKLLFDQLVGASAVK
jgi:hypothetical protein